MRPKFEQPVTRAVERYTCPVCASNCSRTSRTDFHVLYRCQHCGTTIAIPFELWLEIHSTQVGEE